MIVFNITIILLVIALITVISIHFYYCQSIKMPSDWLIGDTIMIYRGYPGEKKEIEYIHPSLRKVIYRYDGNRLRNITKGDFNISLDERNITASPKGKKHAIEVQKSIQYTNKIKKFI